MNDDTKEFKPHLYGNYKIKYFSCYQLKNFKATAMLNKVLCKAPFTHAVRQQQRNFYPDENSSSALSVYKRPTYIGSNFRPPRKAYLQLLACELCWIKIYLQLFRNLRHNFALPMIPFARGCGTTKHYIQWCTESRGIIQIEKYLQRSNLNISPIIYFIKKKLELGGL